MQLENLDFLTSELGQALLAELAPQDLSERHQLGLLTRLRKHYAPDEAGSALELARLRQRATLKFGTAAERMYFTAGALEQASDPLIRAYRAQASQDQQVLDLCCGIGADSLAFAQAGAQVTGVDLDPLRVALARLNAEALGLSAQFIQADVRDLKPPSVDLIFYDPARRDDEGRRIFNVEQYEPPLSLCRAWRGQVLVKLSPAVDKTQVADYSAGLSFLSVAGDLKEAVLHIGMGWQGERAVLLSEQGTLVWQSEGSEPEAQFSTPRAYLIEPDPALLRASYVRHYAEQTGAFMLDETIAYLTSDALPEGDLRRWSRAWRVQAWMPFNLKRLRAELRQRGVGRVTVKKRGSAITPEQLTADLKLKGTNECTLVLTRHQGAPIVLICDPQPT
jgi:hypothetical protein